MNYVFQGNLTTNEVLCHRKIPANQCKAMTELRESLAISEEILGDDERVLSC